MAAYITVLNYVYSLCVFYYGVLSCMADVADCPLQRLSAIVIKNYSVTLCNKAKHFQQQHFVLIHIWRTVDQVCVTFSVRVSLGFRIRLGLRFWLGLES